jgi:hypothetical protein
MRQSKSIISTWTGNKPIYRGEIAFNDSAVFVDYSVSFAAKSGGAYIKVPVASLTHPYPSREHSRQFNESSMSKEQESKLKTWGNW